jgi:hypothetical protein
MSSQWESAGGDFDKLFEPVIFDQRSPEREAKLVSEVFRNRRLKILLSLQKSGSSSPFPFETEIYAMLRSAAALVDFEVINISELKAHRIYDLLGLYDKAAMLITSDTATLHLASSSFVRYIALVANGGGGSLPRGNCRLAVRYKDVPSSLDLLKQTVIANLNN